ncbi:efflux RND transporter periplasmic adaptor subunit [Dongia soli]|uniref:Efflux RND transporter periplasmic adaptor subunit n=1 Tax=Dongia soli TaxID=600628 RepID=A0ABU5EHC0_9PROT|nr:efflux RND transporter periplasmic adaptor subunit [Dongia soli]MDY0885277.1 efflux RND transporter periplasmic adaptor subunit [Dongia soli]
MSQDNATKPNTRLLVILGIVAAIGFGTIAVTGLMSRAHSTQALAAWTNDQAIPTVALAKLQRGATRQTLDLPGTIQAFYRAPIYARVDGYLKSWNADIGAKVQAGQVLGVIDAPDVDRQYDQAKADLAQAQANEQLAAVTAKRWNSLVTSRDVSVQAADEKQSDYIAKKAALESAQANLNRLATMQAFKQITAPFDGTVTARNTDIGALINAGAGTGQTSQLFEVSDLHKMRIYVQVPQAFAGDLHPGLKASFDIPQYAGQHFQAIYVTQSNAVDTNSRSMLVQLQADNPDGKLLANMFCEVHFELPTDPDVLRVPATALIPGNKGIEVALLGDDGKAHLKPIQLGRDFGDTVEVVAGLSMSDHVIDSPPETLVDGDVVRLAEDASSGKVAAAGDAKVN